MLLFQSHARRPPFPQPEKHEIQTIQVLSSTWRYLRKERFGWTRFYGLRNTCQTHGLQTAERILELSWYFSSSLVEFSKFFPLLLRSFSSCFHWITKTSCFKLITIQQVILLLDHTASKVIHLSLMLPTMMNVINADYCKFIHSYFTHWHTIDTRTRIIIGVLS